LTFAPARSDEPSSSGVSNDPNVLSRHGARNEEDSMTWLKHTVLALAALLFGACEAEGSIRIELTDAPSPDLVAAVVTIDQVYLAGDDDSGRVILREDPVVVDLLSLSNDVFTLVDTQPVRDGSYAQLRFVISGAYIEVANGDGTTSIFATPGYVEAPRIDAELRTPSWSSSGFKVQMPEGRLVVQGDQRILLVDFDVASSFTHMTGNGDWVATPVVRALDIQLSSTLHVDVSVPAGTDPTQLGQFDVNLVDAAGLSEGSLPLIDPDGDSVYSADFVFLDPRQGPFTLTVVSPLGPVPPTDPLTPLSVTLTSGTITNVSLVGFPEGTP